MRVLILADFKDNEFAAWLRNRLDDGHFAPDMQHFTNVGIDNKLLNSSKTRFEAMIVVISVNSWERILASANKLLDQLIVLNNSTMKIVPVNIDGRGDSKFDVFNPINLFWTTGKDKQTLQDLIERSKVIKSRLKNGQGKAETEHIPEAEKQLSKELKAASERLTKARESGDKLQLAMALAQRAFVLDEMGTIEQASIDLNEALAHVKDNPGLIVPFTKRITEMKWSTNIVTELIKMHPELRGVKARTPKIGTQEYLSNDLASEEDKLGFTHYVEAFADLIAAPRTGTPLTIGIYGEWGTGKSTLMKLIAGELDKRSKDIKVNRKPADTNGNQPQSINRIDFNAWEYSSCESIWPALVRRVMGKIPEHAGWKIAFLKSRLRRDSDRMRKDPKTLVALLIIWVLLLVVFYTPSYLFDVIPFGNYILDLKSSITYYSLIWSIVLSSIIVFFKLVSSAVQVRFKPIDDWVNKLLAGSQYGEKLGQIQDIEHDLKFLSKQLKASKERFLLLVDDLDRCEPEKAVEMLQAINLLLDQEGIVVILGIDARVITAAVDDFYSKVFDKASISGHEYLEKIVQVPFRIPEASNDQIKHYISSIMRGEESSLVKPSADPEPDNTSVDPPIEKPEVTSGKSGGQELEPVDMGFSDDEVEAFMDHARFLEHNPRHIKRLRNIYLLVRSLAVRMAVPNVLSNHRQLVRWLVMCTQWPYVSSRMIQCFRRQGDTLMGSENGRTPLGCLYDAVKDTLDKKQFAQCDSSLSCLEILVDEREDTPDWETIVAVWPITINFNPAVETAVAKVNFDEATDDVASEPEKE